MLSRFTYLLFTFLSAQAHTQQVLMHCVEQCLSSLQKLCHDIECVILQTASMPRMEGLQA